MTIETRSFAIGELSLRARTKEAVSDDGVVTREATGHDVDGYASVYNSDSEDLGGFIEQVAPGAFARSLEEAKRGEKNIFGFWGHDPNQPIASTKSGSLTLESDAEGLRFTMDGARLNTMQAMALAAGDMRMSFGFRVRDDHWEERDDGVIVRTLLDVDLFEVSPVTFPAYPDTSAAKRAFEAWKEQRSATEQVEQEQQEETVVSGVTKIKTDLLKRFADRRISGS